MKRFVSILTVLLPVSVLYLAGGLEFFERRWMDVQFRLSDRPVHSDIVLVDMDPKSLKAFEVWPWPRGYHATVLENLMHAQARRVAFDIDFSSRQNDEEDAEFARASGQYFDNDIGSFSQPNPAALDAKHAGDVMQAIEECVKRLC